MGECKDPQEGKKASALLTCFSLSIAMSGHVLGLAEKLFSINPRPSALSIEKVISNLVLFDILIQVILIGYILVDDFVCVEENLDIVEALEGTLPPKPAVDKYLELVCGTEIRNDAHWFYVEKCSSSSS